VTARVELVLGFPESRRLEEADRAWIAPNE
jgi:hypothetical protein